jgi:hypothetical protein
MIIDLKTLEIRRKPVAPQYPTITEQLNGGYIYIEDMLADTENTYINTHDIWFHVADSYLTTEVPVGFPESEKEGGGQKTWAEYTKYYPSTISNHTLIQLGYVDENGNVCYNIAKPELAEYCVEFGEIKLKIKGEFLELWDKPGE